MSDGRKRKNSEKRKDAVKKYCGGSNIYSLRNTNRRVSHRNQIMKRAIMDGDIDGVKAMIETFGLSYSEEWFDGYSILCDSLKHDKPEIAKLLLMKGAKVNVETNRQSSTPLHIAAEFGYTEIAKMLLDRNANIHVLDGNDWTALAYAVASNNVEIVEYLIERNMPIDELLMNGETPLFFAVGSGYVDMTALLLKHGARVNIVCWSILLMSECMPLHLAVSNGDESIVEQLLMKGAEIDAKTNNKIKLPHYLALGKSVRFLGLWLRRVLTDDVLDNGNNALGIAISDRLFSVVQLLLLKNPNCNIPGKNNEMPLHIAVRISNLKIVEMLLNNGAKVDAQQKDGLTALHLACKHFYDNEMIIKLLLKHNANIDAVDEIKRTPLHIAIAYNHCSTSILDELITFGANVEARDNAGRTPLHYAAIFGCYEATKVLLLDYGADFNATSDTMLTPLDYGRSEDVTAPDISFGDLCDDYHRVIGFLHDYIISIMALGLYVSAGNIKAIHNEELNAEENGNLMKKCQTRVAKMRTERIGDSSVTIYDLLTANMNKVASYMKNSSFVENARDMVEGLLEFKTYERMINRRVQQGIKRKDLLNASLESIESLLGYNVPSVAALEILKYLCNKDLDNIIIAQSIDKVPN